MSAAAAAVRVARSPYSKNRVLRRAVDYTLALREGGVTGARCDGMRVVDLANVARGHCYDERYREHI